MIRKPLFYLYCTSLICIQIAFSMPAMAGDMHQAKNVNNLYKQAKQTNAAHERRTNTVKCSVALTRAWPRLSKANSNIDDVENNLSRIAHGVRDFEDWSDNLAAAFGFAVAWKHSLAQHIFSLGISCNFSTGFININQYNLRARLPLGDLDYDFEQEYKYYMTEFFLDYQVFQLKKWTGLIGGSISVNYFKVDSKLDADFDRSGLRGKLRGRFHDLQAGCSVKAGLEYAVTRRISMSLLTRYDWLTFTDNNHITTSSQTPFRKNSRHYKQRTVIDITGPSVGVHLNYYF